jgi:hypothetical protein
VAGIDGCELIGDWRLLMVEDQALGLFIHYFQYMGFGITPMPTIFVNLGWRKCLEGNWLWAKNIYFCERVGLT